MKENQNAASVHISLRDRWRHLPGEKHRSIGNALFLLLVPLCLLLSFGMPVLSVGMCFEIIGHEWEVAKAGLTAYFVTASLALAVVSACGLLRLYWVLLGHLAKKFFTQISRHDLTLYLIQDSANRGIYESSYRKYQERVESLETSYQSRIDRLYSENAGAEAVSEVRDEFRGALQEAEAQLEDIRRELLENEGMLGYLEFAAPKLSEVWICLPFGLLCVCVVIIVWILHAITFF